LAFAAARQVVGRTEDVSKMVDLREFWGTDRDKNPALSPTMVQHVEATLGVALPVEYLALLTIQNGGYTRGFVFPTSQRTSWAEDHVALDDLNGIGPYEALPNGLHNIYNSTYMAAEWDLPQSQVLLAGDGHWWISLDYRSRSTPSVRWLAIESGEDLELAPSFADFLAGLRLATVIDENTGRLR
jgi:hypothetical protein